MTVSRDHGEKSYQSIYEAASSSILADASISEKVRVTPALGNLAWDLMPDNSAIHLGKSRNWGVVSPSNLQLVRWVAAKAKTVFGPHTDLGRLVQQITAIFERNRANDDTSIKFDTLVLQVILIKSGRLAN